MRLKNCTLDMFAKELEERVIYCFGASLMPQEICEEYEELHLEQKVKVFVDNDIQKINTKYFLAGKEIPIISIEEMLGKISEKDMVLITSKYYVEILEQLNSFSQLEYIDCYIWPAIAPQYKSDSSLKEKIKNNITTTTIPKKIHYFWFGKGKIPELHQRCIDSWYRICPDYEIIRWDESNYDITKNQYMEEAYQSKKWGFVPDYARLDIIYEYGGIYLDTDVEVIRPFDELLYLDGFAGFESKNLVALGLGFGAKPKNQCLKKLLDDYKNQSFFNLDNSLNLTPSPILQTKVLKKMGLELNNKFQVIEDLAILPAECLSPDNNMIPHITENTFSIHHFAGSWTSEHQQRFLDNVRKFSKSIREI